MHILYFQGNFQLPVKYLCSTSNALGPKSKFGAGEGGFVLLSNMIAQKKPLLFGRFFTFRELTVLSKMCIILYKYVRAEVSHHIMRIM